ncbi:hypothetical protein EYC84_005318 [Monilinia fructicola]|uniref:Uncharacterized protein n=1 Tax=Monilinia fructicola TaxID=38448 RepID=A0A5M9JW44_MONFR|nr:hypothetical protein EYC84_005318 [Monilinia fructicola]
MHATLNSISKEATISCYAYVHRMESRRLLYFSTMNGRVCTEFLPCHVISIRHHFSPRQPTIPVAIPTMKIHFSSEASKI